MFPMLCVDDILLSGNDVSLVKLVNMILQIHKCNGYTGTFSMKDLGEATYILGI